MTRDEIQQALTKINQAIAQLNAQLHPPPPSTAERQQLEAELQAAEAARSALEQALNNLPEEAPAAGLAIAASMKTFRNTHARADAAAAIRVSMAARKRADQLLKMLKAPKKPATKVAAKKSRKRPPR